MLWLSENKKNAQAWNVTKNGSKCCFSCEEYLWAEPITCCGYKNIYVKKKKVEAICRYTSVYYATIYLKREQSTLFVPHPGQLSVISERQSIWIGTEQEGVSVISSWASDHHISDMSHQHRIRIICVSLGHRKQVMSWYIFVLRSPCAQQTYWTNIAGGQVALAFLGLPAYFWTQTWTAEMK